jgi:hypothetical protein
MKPITLVWQRSRDTLWESDWIEYLFQNIPHTTIENLDHSQYIDNSVIIESICWAPYHNSYIDTMTGLGLNFGLIHLTDENSSVDNSSYSQCKFVLRNYYRENQSSHVLQIPLGWNTGFTDISDNPLASDRKHAWSSVIHRLDHNREQMAVHMSTVPSGIMYVADRHGPRMTTQEMSGIYRNSVFVLCPNGSLTPDSFRVTESLEAGCIPIVQRSDYWIKSYGPDFPGIQIDNWSDVNEIIERSLVDPERLNSLQHRCFSYWQTTKTTAVNDVTSLVTTTMNL